MTVVVCVSHSVMGCVDSVPPHTTEDCHYASQTLLGLHGLHFHLLCPDSTSSSSSSSSPFSQSSFSAHTCTSHVRRHYNVYVGPFQCRNPSIISEFELNCTLEQGMGESLDVTVYGVIETGQDSQNKKKEGGGEGGSGEGRRGEVEMVLERAVSFKEPINFREKFEKFFELGVGGMKKEIDELYRRAFASRGRTTDAWHTCTYMYTCIGVGTGGARGASAPPIF